MWSQFWTFISLVESPPSTRASVISSSDKSRDDLVFLALGPFWGWSEELELNLDISNFPTLLSSGFLCVDTSGHGHLRSKKVKKGQKRIQNPR